MSDKLIFRVSGEPGPEVVYALKSDMEELSRLRTEIERLRLKKRPVAWRVKDYADGWIVFQDEAAAYKYAEETGARLQGLYIRDYEEGKG